jgi:SAM-dependent methyltransferase
MLINGAPWYLKLISKLVLSQLPLSYSSWRKLGLFKHGNMDLAEYSIGVLDGHISRAGMSKDFSGKVLLELGPGDTVSTALIARAYGGSSLLVDSGDFASHDLTIYRKLAAHLARLGYNMGFLEGISSRSTLLAGCNSSYFTGGTSSLEKIESKSVDFIFSHAVLEHVQKGDFTRTLRELRRILKDDGRVSHRIDLTDHLGGSLNSLRFSESLWESALFRDSGFYTNRLRCDQIVEAIEDSCFHVEELNALQWSELPISQRALASPFNRMPLSVLSIYGLDLILSPAER